MADGSSKAVQRLKVGDQVRTTDPVTGGTVVAGITRLYLNDDSQLEDLVVRDPAGHESTLHTTRHHLFWDDTSGGWADAEALAPGDRLHSATGDPVVVEAVEAVFGHEWMYDLTVDGVHTFYVIVGGDALLVHNCGSSTGRVVVLGQKSHIDNYMARHPDSGLDADFLNMRGTMRQRGPARLPSTGEFVQGTGAWTWSRNKRFMMDALEGGDEVRLVTDPEKPLFAGGNTYQRELRFLNDRGYGWEQVDDYWRVVRVRP
jgi:hypothetical protein